MKRPTFSLTIQALRDDIGLSAKVCDVDDTAGHPYFRCLDIQVENGPSEGHSYVKFFLPVDDDTALEALVTGILDSCPRLKDKLLGVPSEPVWGGALLGFDPDSPEANGIDPDYEAAWDAHCDAQPAYIDGVYARDAERGRDTTNFCCEHDDHQGHCGLNPHGL